MGAFNKAEDTMSDNCDTDQIADSIYTLSNTYYAQESSNYPIYRVDNINICCIIQQNTGILVAMSICI